MLTARANFTATLLQSSKVLVVGGTDSLMVSGQAMSQVEIYDPSTKQFTAGASLPIAREGHTATLLPSGKVLVVGGYTAPGIGALSSADVYDPATGTWSTAASMHSGRADHAAVLISGGKVLVVGGSAIPPVGIGPHGSASATLAPEIYDPATDSWSIGAMPSLDRPVNPTATLLKDGRVLVVGGQYMLNSPDEASEKADIYDPVSNVWSAMTPETRTGARQFQTATMLTDGRVLIAGGLRDLEPTGWAVVYNAASNSWTQVGNLNQNRCGQGAQLLATGRVLVVATGCGAALLNGATGSAEEFDPSTNRWFAVASLPVPLGLVVTVRLNDGTVLALGGAFQADRTTSAAERFIAS